MDVKRNGDEHVESLAFSDGVECQVSDGDGRVASHHFTGVRQLLTKRFYDVHRDECVG